MKNSILMNIFKFILLVTGKLPWLKNIQITLFKKPWPAGTPAQNLLALREKILGTNLPKFVDIYNN